MKTPTVESTDVVYRCGREASITCTSIAYPEFGAFTRAVEDLVNAVGKLDEDDYWLPMLRKVRRFRFEALASPIPADLLHARLTELLTSLEANIDTFGRSYPDCLSRYRRLIQAGTTLAQTNQSNLLLAIAANLNDVASYRETAILVCAARLVPTAELALASVGLAEVLVSSPTYLRDDQCFQKIIVIGPTRWFPDYVFSAPRGESLLVLKYEWITDHWKHRNAFTAPIKQRSSRLMNTVLDEPRAAWSIQADTLMPEPVDFQTIAKGVADEIHDHDEIDSVQARLFVLEEGWAVFLDADEASSVLVIDLTDVALPVKKRRSSEIEVGMYVLLRTGGGGDFIVPIADQIMGEAGNEAREHQRRWKRLLRSRVVQEGFATIITELRASGSRRANPTNLRNWMSGRSIRTESRVDFEAIMKVLGLGDQRTLYWNLMGQIDRAHRKAGHRIREMLLDRVRSADLGVLKRTGKMEFDLRGEHATSITAFRISAISPDVFNVMPGRIGDPIRQDS